MTAGHGLKMHFDVLNWPVALCSVSVAAFFDKFWQYFPNATTVYAVISALFMVFQMLDKLGHLERFKNKPKPKPEYD